MILIFVSFEEKEHAVKVANYLIDNHLAACVSLIPVDSFYRWEGKKVNYREIEAIIKTRDENFEAVKTAIEKLLSYKIPQIISVKADRANDSYLKWLEKQTEAK